MSWDMIGSAISSINAAIELARGINSASGTLERAELQHRLADMMVALAEAKTALADAMVERNRLTDEIDVLEESLRNKNSVVRRHDAYYDVGEDGKPVGDPYCSRCWEVEHRLVHLVRGRTQIETTCKKCAAVYLRNRSQFSVETIGPLTDRDR